MCLHLVTSAFKRIDLSHTQPIIHIKLVTNLTSMAKHLFCKSFAAWVPLFMKLMTQFYWHVYWIYWTRGCLKSIHQKIEA